MKKSINERIHDLRERSGLTQSDLAIQLGMTRSGVNAWEMGISKPFFFSNAKPCTMARNSPILFVPFIGPK